MCRRNDIVYLSNRSGNESKYVATRQMDSEIPPIVLADIKKRLNWPPCE
jgi:hypothetical protein